MQSLLSRKLPLAIAIFSAALLGPVSNSQAQSKKNVFQTGEELVYKVKYGFVKLGTVVIQTGGIGADGRAQAHMQFWTADVPFLDVKTKISDILETKDITVARFEEHTTDGDKVINKHFEYDKAAKTVTYNDENVKNQVTNNVNPFNDALSLVYNMRAWSGAAGKRYVFQLRGKDGLKPVTVAFTGKTSMQECPALDDKEVKTVELDGQADMGSSSPLGANGAFTAYVSDDDAAIPVRIDMSIAVGSISLVLDKVKHPGWAAAK